jgi:LysM repeat protein
VVAAAVAFIVTLGTGCTNHRPEKNPYLLEKFSSIDESIKEISELKRDIVFLQDEIKYLNEELNNVRTTNGGLTAQEKEQMASFLEKFDRVATISSNLDNMESQLTALAAEAPADVKEALTAPAKDASPALASSAPPAAAPSTQAKAPTKPVLTAQKTTSKATQKSTPTKRRGSYYTVKAKETPQTIAQRNGISVKKLMAANRLPASANLVPGQRIWVP